MKIKYKYIIASLVFLSSCVDNKNKVNFIKINNKEWVSSDSLMFEFNNLDSEKKYNVQLTIKHQTNYSFQNLIMFININNQIDTLNLQLANKNGRWKGKGVRDVRYFSQKLNDIIIEKSDSVKISLNHAMRTAEKNHLLKIHGISSVGVEIMNKID
tara:strand:- start:4020 stop:4487 length:468 start_codon:yes stop_codon:yes gene_type:complete